MNASPYIFKERTATRPGSPLVFTFHGTGADENQLFGLAEQALPDAGVVAPRGDVSEHGALRFFRRTAEGVYDLVDLKRRTDAMAAFVGEHKAAAAPRRTVGIGYSNGANILASVALAHPSLFDDLVLMHPLVTWSPTDDPALSRLNVLITAGRRDPICPPATTIALAEFLTRQKSKVTLEWHDGGHETRSSEMAAIANFLGAG
jgi:phospholipase/carboxylesterase